MISGHGAKLPSRETLLIRCLCGDLFISPQAGHYSAAYPIRVPPTLDDLTLRDGHDVRAWMQEHEGHRDQREVGAL